MLVSQDMSLTCDTVKLRETPNGENRTVCSKKCSRCQQIKLIDDFATDKSKSSGIRSYCKQCYNDSAKISNAKRTAALKAKRNEMRMNANVVQVQITTKVCRMCNIEQPLGNFHPSKQRTGGVRGECKQCFNKAAQERKAARKKEPV